jgi:hypothetical protein
MAAYMKFQEYLDRNKKVSNSAPVKKIADYEGPIDNKPPKEKKHKNSGGDAPGGGGHPYKAGSDGKDPNKGKLNDGFAGKGDSKLKYTPDTDLPKDVASGGSKVKTWPKTKTQEWVDRTRGMSLAEFTKAIRDEALKGLEECGCQKAPDKNIKDTVNLCKCNKKNIGAFVREMKRNGLFGKLALEMVQHPETFKVLALAMEKDESYARKLVKAINEMVAPPMGDDAGMMPKKKKKPMLPHGHPHDLDMHKGHPHDDMGMGDDLGLDDDDLAGLGGDEDDLDGLGNEDDYPDGGGPGMGGDEDDLDGLGNEDDYPDGGGPGMGGDDDDMGMGGPPHMKAPHDKMNPAIKKKPKKKHAHHHLLGAMKDHPALHPGMHDALGMGGM